MIVASGTSVFSFEHFSLLQLCLFCLFLLMVSFVFSGTETAFFSLQKIDKQRLSNAGSTGRRILYFLNKKSALITTLLIGNETVNVCLASVGVGLFAKVLGDPESDLAPYLNVLIVTPTLVLMSEITPKVLAYRFNRAWVNLAVWPLTVFYYVVILARVLVQAIVGLLSTFFGVSGRTVQEGLKEEELLTLIDQGTAAGTVDTRERDMIESVFEFDDLTVARVMTPRPDIFSVPLNIGWTGLIRRVEESGFSRIPVYGKGSDDIVGVMLLKDILKHQKTPPSGPRQLRSLLMPPVFVPHSKPATDMLQEFLRQRNHIAFVVDEHGTLIGMVTLDDLLEELFGEIPDEDSEERSIVTFDRVGTYVVNAGMDVEDFTEETGLALPEGEYHTVGGFVFHELGRLPRRGDKVVWNGNRFIVRTMDGRRVAKLQVKVASTIAHQEATV